MKLSILVFSIICYSLAITSGSKLLGTSSISNNVLLVIALTGLPGLILIFEWIASCCGSLLFKPHKPSRLEPAFSELTFLSIQNDPPEPGETVILGWQNDSGDLCRVKKGYFARGQWKSDGVKLDSIPTLWLPVPKIPES